MCQVRAVVPVGSHANRPRGAAFRDQSKDDALNVPTSADEHVGASFNMASQQVPIAWMHRFLSIRFTDVGSECEGQLVHSGFLAHCPLEGALSWSLILHSKPNGASEKHPHRKLRRVDSVGLVPSDSDATSRSG